MIIEEIGQACTLTSPGNDMLSARKGKALKKLGIEGIFLNIVKAAYDKPITNIILSGEQLNPFLLKSGMRQGCSLFPFLFNIVLGFLA
jgi:hypothetical protein